MKRKFNISLSSPIFQTSKTKHQVVCRCAMRLLQCRVCRVMSGGLTIYMPITKTCRRSRRLYGDSRTDQIVQCVARLKNRDRYAFWTEKMKVCRAAGTVLRRYCIGRSCPCEKSLHKVHLLFYILLSNGKGGGIWKK